MQALVTAQNFVTGIDFVLSRGSYYIAFLKSVMAYPTWRLPTNVQKYVPSTNIMKCGSKRGSSAIPEWGRIKVWVAEMQSCNCSSVNRGRKLVG